MFKRAQVCITWRCESRSLLAFPGQKVSICSGNRGRTSAAQLSFWQSQAVCSQHLLRHCQPLLNKAALEPLRVHDALDHERQPDLKCRRNEGRQAGISFRSRMRDSFAFLHRRHLIATHPMAGTLIFVSPLIRLCFLSHLLRICPSVRSLPCDEGRGWNRCRNNVSYSVHGTHGATRNAGLTSLLDMSERASMKVKHDSQG